MKTAAWHGMAAWRKWRRNEKPRGMAAAAWHQRGIESIAACALEIMAAAAILAGMKSENSKIAAKSGMAQSAAISWRKIINNSSSENMWQYGAQLSEEENRKRRGDGIMA